ncbi:ABC transporter ATP-binding protein [Roseateles sp. GG27B]
MQFGQLQQSMVAAARVRSLLLETAPVAETASGRAITQGDIAIEHLSFGYDAELPVLHELNLQIPAGAFVGIVGHTGSGKSTLLSLLLRFYTAQSGRITIGGWPLASLPDEAFRQAVGLVPQEPYLMAASARENIAMGRAISEERLIAAARAARIDDFISALPQGYDTLLGDGGVRVSTGQKQLIAMARALAGEPKILFLDEATANIDSATEQVVSEALTALRGRVTVVAIAHRLSTIRDADQIIVLNHGQLVERGNHAELMAHPGGLYQRLVQLQDWPDWASAEETKISNGHFTIKSSRFFVKAGAPGCSLDGCYLRPSVSSADMFLDGGPGTTVLRSSRQKTLSADDADGRKWKTGR